METALWLEPQLNEITFEHRNKSYGAFPLRTDYHRKMAWSMLLAILFFVALFLGIRYYLVSISKTLEDIITIIETPVFIDQEYTIERPKQKPITRSAPQPTSIQQTESIPRVVNEEQVVETTPIPAETEILPMVEGTSSSNSTSASETITGTETETGLETNPDIGIEVNTTVPIYMVDQQPEFPGGTEAMYKYLKSHLSYPQMAREIRVSGTVVMQFVVSATGEIEKVTIVRTPSSLFNKISLETIEGMPQWKPGIYKGKAVPVIFTLPLKFELL